MASSVLNIEPPPTGSQVIDRQSGLMRKAWIDWLTLALLARIQSQPFIRTTVTLTGQNASIGSTALLSAVPAGLYRVSWYFRKTTADGVSSSLQITIGSADGGISITQSGAAVATDTTAAVQSGSVVVRSDAISNITYATTYASNTPGQMQYRLDVVAEPLS